MNNLIKKKKNLFAYQFTTEPRGSTRSVVSYCADVTGTVNQCQAFYV